jgi:mono/diheme cytochrome c family protein
MPRPASKGRPVRRASLVVGGLVAVWAIAVGATPDLPRLPAHPGGAVTALSLLTQTYPDTAPDVAVVRRGQQLVVLGDCMSCHLRKGGEPFAGGLPLKTPFGVIHTSNITSDATTGIGSWTPEQFDRAMRDGIGIHGENLYPAFPYPWFRLNSRADNDAILAYLKTTPAVNYSPPANDLRFPFNFRFLVKGWNLLFLKSAPFEPTPGQSTEWNRGAYLVDGLGHCSGCHSPKNLFGADKSGQRLHGGSLAQTVAPDLTGNVRTGLGAWSADDIATFLATGRNARAGAGSDMADVVTYSTALMHDDDRRAIAVYLKSLGPSPDVATATADPATMKRGETVFSDYCTACHLDNAVGQPHFFPPLGHNAMVQQANPTGVAHVILGGSRVGASPTRPSPLAMPTFAWKLTDDQVADVSTYVRNSWGNQASPVTSEQVRTLRRELGLDAPRRAENSGDER